MKWNSFWCIFNFAVFWQPNNLLAPANLFLSGALFAIIAIDVVTQRGTTSS